MTLDNAKIALRNGASFGDAYLALTTTGATNGVTLDALQDELRQFYCYDLPPRELLPPAVAQPSTSIVEPKTTISANHTSKLSTKAAREQGYEGSPCSTCGGMRVKRNGACLLCEECGSSSGCS